ncbi:duf537-domain-containing partial [Phaffia rhodozyma]|uniref:Duf537-domain-containing partial n=1 Tax=Phaffia rhodozyma TaxID=264483 RepID=A0A0F7SRX6_PHARH|nr:duf537-domain-containing partial [Phaffia rhodozyma]
MMLRLTIGRVGAGFRVQHGLAFRFQSTTHAKGPVGIFWDIENCSPYNYTSPAKLMRSLRTVFHRYGPIASVRSYQDVSKYTLNEIDRAGYSACGLQMVDTPHLGRKNVADWHMMTDIVGFAFNNPLHSTIIVITTDRDYCSLLNMLSNRMYNIVLVTNIEHVIEELASSASVMYNWKEFLDHASNGQKLNLSIEPPIKPHHTGLDPHWPSTVAHVPRKLKSSRLKSESMSPRVFEPSRATSSSSTTAATSPSVIAPPTTTTVEPEPVTISTSTETSSESSFSSLPLSGLSMENSQGWSSTAFRVSTQSDAIYPLICPKIREKYNAVIRSMPRSHHNIISFGELTKQIERLQPNIIQSLGVASMSEVIEEAIRDGVLVLTNKGPKTHQLKLSRRVYQKSGLGAWLIRSGWGNKFDEIKALERVKHRDSPFIPVESAEPKSAEANVEKDDKELSEVTATVVPIESTNTVSSATFADSGLVTNSDTPSTAAILTEPTPESAPVNDSRCASDGQIHEIATFQVSSQQDLMSMPPSRTNLTSSPDEPVPALSTEECDDSLSVPKPAQTETTDDDLTIILPLESGSTPTPTPESTSETMTTASFTLNIPTLSTFVDLDDGSRPSSNSNPSPNSSPSLESASGVKPTIEPTTSATKSKRKRKQVQKQVHDEAIQNIEALTKTNENENMGATSSGEGAKDAVSDVISSNSNIVSDLREQVVNRTEEADNNKIGGVKIKKKTKNAKGTVQPKKKKKNVGQLEVTETVKRPRGRPRKSPTPGVLPKKNPPKSIGMPRKKREEPSSEALAIKASVPSDRPWRILSSVLAKSPDTAPSPASSPPTTLSTPPPSSLLHSTSSVSDLQYRKLTPPDPTRVKLFSSFGVKKRLPHVLPLQTPSSHQARASGPKAEQEITLSILNPSLV